MDLANLIVEACVNIWSSWIPKYGVLFLVFWMVLNKVQLFKRSRVWDSAMEYAGLVVLFLMVSLAFAYGGWIGVSALALVIALR